MVRRFEGRPGVRVVFEDRPSGKGHAVRTGLAHVTGTIVLIQDADFEYDIDDYDALLEPILQHKATFVLGSRSLGLDDWKVRKYDKTPIKGLVLNFAQVVFARTYDVLYQQSVTDVNTMYKVFRSECLEGLDLESDGFELDIELACKLARNGNSPMEVPVNYVARGFDEGKKIRPRDAWVSYAAFFKYRWCVTCSILLRPFVVAPRPVLRAYALVLLAVRERVVDQVLEPRARVLVGEILQLAAGGGVVAEQPLVPQALQTQRDEAEIVRPDLEASEVVRQGLGRAVHAAQRVALVDVRHGPLGREREGDVVGPEASREVAAGAEHDRVV